ncbi:beta-ketoacyl reductase, partial [Micromonospora chalcea]
MVPVVGGVSVGVWPVAVGSVVPDVVVVSGVDAAGVLGVLRGWLGDSRFVGSRLVVVTRGADVVAGQGGVAGLVRSAVSEHPGRFVLVDVGADADVDAVGSLAAGLVALGESEFWVRGGEVCVPRLRPVGGSVGAAVWSAGDCVLVTGGTGALGAVVARHLVVSHGVSRVVLVSRRGGAAEGVAGLVAELGADRVSVVAGDVTDRSVVAGVLSRFPVSAVVHAAGVLDDGVVEGLSGDRLARVWEPKVVAAQVLDELTRDRGLSAFVVFSSVAGVLGTAGQGAYAAANAGLDAVVRARRAAGLVGTSVAWGLWAGSSGMTGSLSGRDLARLSRSGLAALGTDEALTMLDAA